MSPESRRIKHADEIVSFAKRVSREVASFVLPEGIDFIGCSEPYVREKLNAAIADLQWMKRRMTEVDKLNRSKKEAGDELP